MQARPVQVLPHSCASSSLHLIGQVPPVWRRDSCTAVQTHFSVLCDWLIASHRYVYVYTRLCDWLIAIMDIVKIRLNILEKNNTLTVMTNCAKCLSCIMIVSFWITYIQPYLQQLKVSFIFDTDFGLETEEEKGGADFCLWKNATVTIVFV